MKTFILGVGAQKAGTTWLFKQIKNHPNFKMGVKKEMRVFGGTAGETWLFKQIKNHPNFKKGVRKEMGVFGFDVKNLNNFKGKQEKIEKFINSLRKNPEEYFEYFEKLAAPDEISHVGEMTPIYCDLEESKFKFI